MGMVKKSDIIFDSTKMENIGKTKGVVRETWISMVEGYLESIKGKV